MEKFSEAEVKAFVVRIATYKSIEDNTTVAEVMKDFIESGVTSLLEDNYALYKSQSYPWVLEDIKEYKGL